MIPKRLHFIWIGPEVPAEAVANIETWRRLCPEPEWEIRVWRDADCEALVSVLYPWLWEIYQAGHAGERCEVARYAVLHRFGGVYSDVDAVLQHPLDPLLGFGCWFGLMNTPDGRIDVNTGVIGAVPTHPFIERLVEAAPGNWKAWEHTGDQLHKIGPPFVMREIHRWRAEGFKPYTEEVTLLPQEVLYPRSHHEVPDPAGYPRAISVHQFWGSWWRLDRAREKAKQESDALAGSCVEALEPGSFDTGANRETAERIVKLRLAESPVTIETDLAEKVVAIVNVGGIHERHAFPAKWLWEHGLWQPAEEGAASE